MPSILPGYTYDIFVSYRHKDNRNDGWVSAFIASLKRELESTFKEDLSIYFDENPHDGILETHDVDQTLGSKIKCLVFIPVLSQTYCDPKSFAWQQEFCTFNKMSGSDSYGRDIRLRNGNVASRVLPVAIHDLDPEDRELIENELKAKLRFIEFIFRSPGVNRPLRLDDRREDNTSRLFYRDQINKVANAVKEILTGIKYPDRITEASKSTAEGEPQASSEARPPIDERSIAVLPFVSLAQDSSQDYFADGITENILIELSAQKKLRVISRTSVMRYKKTTKTVPEIAAELGVKYILEGSAQSHGNKVRIHVQLIDALPDNPLWSKSFVEDLDDIFAIQSSVAEVVAKELNTSLEVPGKEVTKTVPIRNVEAYDLFLKGRHAFNQWNLDGYRSAEKYFTQAIEKDPGLTEAYSYLASTYSALMSWNGDLSPAEAVAKLTPYLEEAMRRGATDNDYQTKAFVEFFVSKDFAAAEQHLLKALEMNPNNSNVLFTYCYLLNMMGRTDEAWTYMNKAKAIDPLSVAASNYEGISLYLMGRYAEAAATFKEALQLYPMALRQYDHLARVYLTMGKFDEAAQTVLAGLSASRIRPPSMIAYLAAAYAGLGNLSKCEELLDELIRRSGENEKGVNLYVAHVFNAMGRAAEARDWLSRAEESNDIDLIWKGVDPLLKGLTSPSRPDYTRAENFIWDKLRKELPKDLIYHNIQHVQDVLDSALRIAEAENVPAEEVRLLRLAALYHDAGLIESHREHEEAGCRMAKKTLPVFGIPEKEVEAICGMILATRIPQTPHTHLQKILCDADLDYLGREDFLETGHRLYEELKSKGYVETEREWNLIQRTFLQGHRYHTPFAIKNREPQKLKHLDEIGLKLQKRP